MTTITEADVEQTALQWLEGLGWATAYGPVIGPDAQNPERDDYDQVVLEQRLLDALADLNPNLPSTALDDAVRKLMLPQGATLEARNRNFHKMLVEGVQVDYRAPDGSVRGDAVAVLLEVHDQILRMLHPFIPFVTEEIWQALPQHPEDGVGRAPGKRTITLAAYPQPCESRVDTGAASAISLLQEVVTAIRTVRSEWGVPPARRVRAIIEAAPAEDETLLRTHAGQVARLAGVEELQFAASVPKEPDIVRRVVRDFQIHVPLAGIVDRVKETERVRRDLAKLVKQRGALQARLANVAFVERADPAVVEEARNQEQASGQRQAKLNQILEELGG